MIDYTANRAMMVDTQVRPSDVTKFPIIDALLTVRREAFVPEGKRSVAYAGGEIALSDSRVVLEPRTFAKMLDALDIQREDLILDLGCGLGYSSAVLAHMGDAVVAVEADEDLAKDAEHTLREEGIDNAVVETGPLAAGASKHGPYDVICIQGGVESVPAELTDQLKEGGRIAALFVDGGNGEVRIGYKSGDRVSWRMSFNATAPVLDEFKTARSFAL